MIRDIDYLVLSDIHLGHRRTSTVEIVKNLTDYFSDFSSKSQFSDLDIIFIAGDLFDNLLDFSSPDIHEVTIWISRLMSFCVRFGIKLRVLEGTPSHDWKQSRIVNTLSMMMDFELNVKYIETLHIEHIKDLDITILYVPDEWTASTETTFQQVEELLKENHLDKVDIAIMHGCFSYQVKHIPVKLDSHDENKYLDIVRYFINIGHFHSFSTFNRIIAQGSFDRLTHGEEESKGAVRVRIGKEPQFFFIENKGAKTYKTITIRSRDMDKVIHNLTKQLKVIKSDSYVRIKAVKDHPVYTALDEIKLRFPEFVFTKVTEESVVDKANLATRNAIEVSDYTPISITKDNIIELITNAVTDKYKPNQKEIALLSPILRDTHASLS